MPKEYLIILKSMQKRREKEEREARGAHTQFELNNTKNP